MTGLKEFQQGARSQMTCAKEQSCSNCIHDSVGLEVKAMLSLEASSMVVNFFFFFFLMNKSIFHIETKLGDSLQLINNKSCKTTFGIPSPW